MNSKQGFALPAILIVLAIVLVGGVAYMIRERSSRSAQVLQPIPPLASNTQTSGQLDDLPSQQEQLSAWKTFRSDQYGFEIQYPPSLTYNWASPAGITTLNFSNGSMTVLSIPLGVDKGSLFGRDWQSLGMTTIGGLSAEKLSRSISDRNNVFETAYVVSSKTITFYFPSPGEVSLETEEKMLQSIRFLR